MVAIYFGLYRPGGFLVRFQVVFATSRCSEHLEMTWSHLELALGEEIFVGEINLDNFLLM